MCIDQGNITVFDSLLEAGYPVNEAKGFVSLSFVILKNKEKLFDQHSGYYPMSILVRNGNLLMLEKLSKKYRLKNVINEDSELNSLLHLAIFYGHHNILKLLLDVSENIDVINRYGHTPINLASQKKDIKSIKILLEFNPRLI